MNLPSVIEPGSYFIVPSLRDATFHSLAFLTPFSKKTRTAVEPQPARVVTRSSAERLASAPQPTRPVPARVVRSSTRAHEPVSPELERTQVKRPRLEADKRFVVVYQMLLDTKPVLLEATLQELERTRSMNPYA